MKICYYRDGAENGYRLETLLVDTLARTVEGTDVYYTVEQNTLYNYKKKMVTRRQFDEICDYLLKEKGYRLIF